MYTIITENDESQWKDETGVLYHFPKRYLKYLQPDAFVIYYKGKLLKSEYRETRLSDAPHYFATARIRAVYPDPNNIADENYYAVIRDFHPFAVPVLAKNAGVYLEVIPTRQEKNYWRNGVRPITLDVFKAILSRVEYNVVQQNDARYDNLSTDLRVIDIDFESMKEGQPNQRFVTLYERNPVYRKAALLIHGCRCKACGFEFENFYGDYAKGFIHVHHINPVSEIITPTSIDPATDLIPLCPNCHSVIHYRKDKTLTIDELIEMIESTKVT